MGGPVSAAREDRDGQPWLPGTERGVACVSVMLWWALTVLCITEPAHDCVLCNSKEGTHLAGFLHHLWSFSYLQKAVCKSAFEPDHTHSQHRLWCVTGSDEQQSCHAGEWEGRGSELPGQQGVLTSLCRRAGAAAWEACREGIAGRLQGDAHPIRPSLLACVESSLWVTGLRPAGAMNTVCAIREGTNAPEQFWLVL